MGHNHSHSNHSHSHAHSKNKKALTISFVLIFSYMIIEFIGGYFTNSLALISDAGHMLSDAAALGLSLSALIFGQRAATPEKTYGYKRFEILAALLNGIVLVLISLYILKEAIERLQHPVTVIGKGMIIISTIGLIVNLIVAWILSRGETKDNLNIRSAFLHVIGDLLGSVGAIIAAVLIILFGWYIADPIASMIVSVLILYSGWRILKDSIHILMESKPSHINTEKVISALKNIPQVKDVHDLHIWMITSDFPSLTAHLEVEKETNRDEILERAIKIINKETGIKHVTIQIESETFDLKEGCCGV